MHNFWEKENCCRKIFFAAVFVFIFFAGALSLYFLYPVAREFFPKCPFYEMFHFYCPGCGSTRATFFLLHGDIPGVFRSNLIYLPSLFFIVILILKPKKLPSPWIAWGWFIMICLFWILRNFPWYPFHLLAPSPVPF